MHPSLIVLHTDETAENPYSVIDMDYIIPYCERRKVIDGKLLALLDRPSDAYAMETVEYLVVAVAADLVLMIDESVMDILPGYEFRKNRIILR